MAYEFVITRHLRRPEQRQPLSPDSVPAPALRSSVPTSRRSRPHPHRDVGLVVLETRVVAASALVSDELRERQLVARAELLDEVRRAHAALVEGTENADVSGGAVSRSAEIPRPDL